MVLKQSRFKPFYGCTRWSDAGCRGTHGAHPDGSPMGVPATLATKRARMEAHAAFDKLWKDGRMKRRAAYLWMQRAMNLPEELAHIGMFDADQCQLLVMHVERELGVVRP